MRTMSPRRRIEPVDVVVVGSGPVGSTFARVIADQAPASSVLMVEVGPQTTDPPGRHTVGLPSELAKTAMQRAQGPEDQEAHLDYDAVWQRICLGKSLSVEEIVNRPGLFRIGGSAQHPGEDGMIAASMTSAVGGMGVLWNGSCPRPSAFERIPFIAADDLAVDLANAERLLGVSVFDSALGRAVVRALCEEFDRPGRRPVQLLPLAGHLAERDVTSSGTDAILGDLLSRSRVGLRSNTLCREVIVESGRAVGVVLEDRITGARSMQPTQVVLIAADGLRTSQLLFASHIRPPALGHNLNEHANVVSLIKLNDEIVDTATEVEGSDPCPVFATWIPLDGVHLPYHGQVLQVGRIGPGDGRFRLGMTIAGLSCYSAKQIQFDDAVHFSETDVDSYGMPAMEISYTQTELDRVRVTGLFDFAERATRQLGTRLHSDPILMPNGYSMHYQGATRMGLFDDGTSVCDMNGRVWGLKNVFLGGNGVIPTPTACNPTVTSVALAVRCARYVATRHLT
jgi:C-glycoside oxidase